MKFEIVVISSKSVEKIQVSLILVKNNGTLHEAQYTFLVISHSIFFLE
jgi:hypothetical protein